MSDTVAILVMMIGTLWMAFEIISLRARIFGLEAENARLRAALVSLEWSATTSRGGFGSFSVCPRCDGAETVGHDPGCALAAALSPESSHADR